MGIQGLRKDDFYMPVLTALNELGGSGQVEEIDNRVVELTGLGASDLETIYEKSGALMVPDKISWARTYLKQGDLIKSEGRGLWLLTDRGRDFFWSRARQRLPKLSRTRCASTTSVIS